MGAAWAQPVQIVETLAGRFGIVARMDKADRSEWIGDMLGALAILIGVAGMIGFVLRLFFG